MSYSDEEGTRPSGYYDIDQGHKKSLFHSVQTSPKRYRIVQSSTERFADRRDVPPFGAYNTDTAHKKGLESNLRDNRRFYASAFDSKAPRLARPQTSAACDSLYDCSWTKSGRPATVHASLEHTPVRYHILRSRYRRFPDHHSEAPDVTYDIDRGNKASLVTSMQHSSVAYKNVATSTKRFPQQYNSSTPTHVGPGSYDFPYTKDLLKAEEAARPLSTLASTSSRFYNDKQDPSKDLGSTWRQERDSKHWGRRSLTIPKAEVLRPPYLPKAYLIKQQANQASPKKRESK